MINREHWSTASRQIFFWHYFCFWVSMDLVQNLLIKIKKTVHGPGPRQGVHGPGPWKWSMDPVQRGGTWTPGPCFVLTHFHHSIRHSICHYYLFPSTGTFIGNKHLLLHVFRKGAFEVLTGFDCNKTRFERYFDC